MLNPVSWLIVEVLNLYIWVILISVVMSWLVVLDVVNLRNRFANAVVRALDVLTEPVYARVRRVVPPIAGLDFSPLVVLFAVMFLQYLVRGISFRLMF